MMRLRHAVVVMALVPILLAVLALIGWSRGWTDLVTLLPNARAMQPLTAVGLLICGMSLCAFVKCRPKLAAVGGLALFAIGLQTPLQSFPGMPFVADLSLFGDVVSRQQPPMQFPGRPSMIGSTTFILFSIALMGVAFDGRWGRRTYVWASSLGLTIAFMGLLGFLLLLGEPTFDADDDFVMPVHTGLGMSSAFAGLLLLRANSNWTGILLDPDWRGRTARAHIAGATFPAILAIAASLGHIKGWYSTDFRMLLIVLGSMAMIGVFVLLTAQSLGKERNILIGYAKALDLSPNFTLANDGSILTWSKGAEKLYGWTPAEAVGGHCEALLGWSGYVPKGASAAPYPDADADAQQAGIAWQGELHHRTRDGGGVTVLARGVGFRLIGTDAPVELISVTDVTEERRIRAELDARNLDLMHLQAELLDVSRRNSMNEMAAALAHELNQPLTAAGNFLGVVEFGVAALELGKNPLDFATLHNANRRARAELLRAGEIIGRLRDFISGGDGEHKVHAMHDIMHNASALALVGSNHSATIECKFDPAAENVLVDAVQIQQVAVNLILNAMDAMAELPDRQRRIQISTIREGADMVRVTVADNGTGLSPGVSASLFKPFVSSKRTGMGVGLSICRRIVEAHHGKIWATNNPDQGASFHFTLPLAIQPEEVT